MFFVDYVDDVDDVDVGVGVGVVVAAIVRAEVGRHRNPDNRDISSYLVATVGCAIVGAVAVMLLE